MKKIFKLVIITMVTILGCSLYNFTYANEEDGRLVDIPVPPSSTGQAGFTVEESKNQEGHYSEQANNKYEFNYNKEIEEEQKREEQTENKVTDTISDITEKNNEISNTNINQNINEITNTNTESKDNKMVTIISIAVVLFIIVLIIVNSKKKNK
jgi:hypothetical protein